MFGFMKKHSDKDKEEKERRKREKKEKKELKKVAKERPLTQDELLRLEEAKKHLMRKGDRISQGYDGMAVPYQSGDPAGASDSSEASNVSTPQEEHRELPGNQGSRELTGHQGNSNQYTSYKQVELSKPHKPSRDTRSASEKARAARGILKGKSSFGPDIPNQGVRGNLDDTATLEDNTYMNEMMSGRLPTPPEASDGKKVPPPTQPKPAPRRTSSRNTPPKSGIAHHRSPMKPTDSPPLPPSTPPPATPSYDQVDGVVTPDHIISPTEKTFGGMDLQLPNVAPPRAVKPREIILRRQPAGDFGFTLRRGTILERSAHDNAERKRVVIFAEPGPKNMNTGLLPGDRLIEVNDINVENSNREEIIEHIKKSGQAVVLKVQPIPELSELSIRSGMEGEEVPVQEQSVKTGTLQRTGSMRYKSRVSVQG